MTAWSDIAFMVIQIGASIKNYMIDFVDLSQPAEAVAPLLIGSLFVRDLGAEQLIGRIVEVEAYSQIDAASHSYKGRTPRTDIMFGPSGHLYVYFTYGMHYCCNIVTGQAGEGSAVLIRALEPIEGLPVMKRNRGGVIDSQLTNGPAKLCQALRIDKKLNGHDLSKSPLKLTEGQTVLSKDIVTTTRIGITRDTHR